MARRPVTGKVGRRASLRPAAGLFLLISLMFFCPSVHAGPQVPEAGSITIRDLQAVGNRAEGPVATTGETGGILLRSLQVAQAKPEEEATPVAAPAVGATPPPADEYGDVTAEEVGEAPAGAAAPGSSDEYGDVATDDAARVKPPVQIADPIRPFNVVMYHFNDRLYFWVWKPAATGYKYVVPREVRSILENFYENLKTPVRVVNNLLQGKPGYAGEEVLKFLINSTVGVGGLRNCAEECFGIRGRYADFGQTLGKYGMGFGFYLVLPFLGPSSARDGFGFLVDWALRPQTYLSPEFFSYESVGLFTHEKINSTSFHIGEYEALKKASVDPYVSMRDIYIQYRTDLIKNR